MGEKVKCKYNRSLHIENGVCELVRTTVPYDWCPYKRQKRRCKYFVQEDAI